ncbi:MAG: hypothetical protein J5933_00095, partial [Clostridia bacterium]|nr:hypothetical protein [Clostridia bacterium]
RITDFRDCYLLIKSSGVRLISLAGIDLILSFVEILFWVSRFITIKKSGGYRDEEHHQQT